MQKTVPVSGTVLNFFYKPELVLNLDYFLTLVLSAARANSVRQLKLVALGAFNQVRCCKLPVSTSFISSGF